jgi:Ca2+-binding EF-hand superfamily protein
MSEQNTIEHMLKGAIKDGKISKKQLYHAAKMLGIRNIDEDMPKNEMVNIMADFVETNGRRVRCTWSLP